VAITASAARTLIVPVTKGNCKCLQRPLVWPAKPVLNTGWDCYLNISADLKDSGAVINTVTVSAVYTDGVLTLSQPITSSTPGLIGVSFSAGTGGYVYAIQFLVTFQDGREFAYYAALPVSATPVNQEE